MSNLRMGLSGKLAKSIGVHLLCWIATYPVDKVIHSLDNWGQNIGKSVSWALFHIHPLQSDVQG